MDDPLLVRFLEGLGDLPRDVDRLVDRNRAAADPLGEVLTLDQLHGKKGHRAGACRLFGGFVRSFR